MYVDLTAVRSFLILHGLGPQSRFRIGEFTPCGLRLQRSQWSELGMSRTVKTQVATEASAGSTPET